MSVPPGFEVINNKLTTNGDSVYEPSKCALKLKRSLYGLHQSPLTWFECPSKGLNKQALFASDNDPCLFIKEGVIALVYVDDTLCFSKDADNIPKPLKGSRDDGFELTDEGKIQDFLGTF